MFNMLRLFFLIILNFIKGKIIWPIFQVIDAFYARRKFQRLFEETSKLYNQYIHTRNLFIMDGGYESNKEQIASNLKIIKQNAESFTEAISILHNDWKEFFNESSHEILKEELEVLEEIRKFSEQNG